MSDLQCPARLFVASHGAGDDDRSRALAESLDGERIAGVWCSPLPPAVQTAGIAAGVLGVDVVVREGLREPGMGGVLAEVADAHRGEGVLVISHHGAIRTAVPSLAANLSPSQARGLPLDSCDVVALEGDADGWIVRRWAGRAID